MNVGDGKVQITEEGAGHQLIIVLTCVNEDVIDRLWRTVIGIGRKTPDEGIVPLGRRDNWRGLHKVGPRAKDDESLHFVNSEPSKLDTGEVKPGM